MNRINKVFQKDGTIMSIYFTAGFPAKISTNFWREQVILRQLAKNNKKK